VDNYISNTFMKQVFKFPVIIWSFQEIRDDHHRFIWFVGHAGVIYPDAGDEK